jgi:hypothetical protein
MVQQSRQELPGDVTGVVVFAGPSGARCNFSYGIKARSLALGLHGLTRMSARALAEYRG